MQQAEARAYRMTTTANNPLIQEEQGQIRRVRKLKKTNHSRKVLVKTGVVLFAYALLLVFLCCKSAILSYQIAGLEKDIHQLETSQHRLEYQISQESSLARIETVAIKELGMSKPDLQAFIPVEYTPNEANAQLAAKSDPGSAGPKQGTALHRVYNNLVRLARND